MLTHSHIHGIMAFSLKYLAIYFNTLEIFIDTTRDIQPNRVKTNAEEQSVSFMTIDIWKDLSSSLKELTVFAFPKYKKRYLLS